MKKQWKGKDKHYKSEKKKRKREKRLRKREKSETKTRKKTKGKEKTIIAIKKDKRYDNKSYEIWNIIYEMQYEICMWYIIYDIV